MKKADPLVSGWLESVYTVKGNDTVQIVRNHLVFYFWISWRLFWARISFSNIFYINGAKFFNFDLLFYEM